MFDELYEDFERIGVTYESTLNEDVYAIFEKLSNEKISMAINTFNKHIYSNNNDLETDDTLYNFVSNSDLSGGIDHCANLPCRLDKINELINFTTLYADIVLIPNRFEDYCFQDSFSSEDRIRIAEEIIILWRLCPLISEGIIRFAVNEHQFCEDCFRKYSSNEFYNYEKKNNQIMNTLKNEIQSNIKATYYTDNFYGFVEIKGPEHLIEHGVKYLHFVQYTPDFLEQRKESKIKLSRKEIESLKIINVMSKNTINDFTYQDWYTRNFNYSYLTNRELDRFIFDEVNKINKYSSNTKLYNALAHSLPILQQCAVVDLISLRKECGDSFDLYRYKMKELIKELPADTKCALEAFNDIVNPELLKLNIKMKEAKNSLVKNSVRNILITSGIISIGLKTGILPNDITTLISTAGACGLTQTALNSITENTVKSKAELKENPYYFIWKAKKLK